MLNYVEINILDITDEHLDIYNFSAVKIKLK